MIAQLDTALGRQSIYRVVTGVLVLLAAVSVVLGRTGGLDGSIFAVDAMLLTLAVLVGSSVAATTLLGRVRGVRPQRESAVITGLLLWFLYWPTTAAAELAWLALVAVVANVSKYVVVYRGRHLLNPAATGVVAVAVLAWLLGQPAAAPYTTWWVGSEALFGWVVAGVVVLLWRLRRWLHSLAFVALAGSLTVWGLLDTGLAGSDALRFAFLSSPVVFFAGLMLTEPLTLGPRRRHQVLAAAVAAIVFTLPLTALAAGFVLHTEAVGGTYEVALLAANLVAFACGQRGSALRFLGRRDLGDSTVEFTFAPVHGLRFTPGQYLELDLAPTGSAADRRGLRRMLSISSAPGELVTVAVRVPERPSRFKQALLALEPGDQVRATSVGGDFVLPRGEQPLLLVAGGIGVTPYLSHLRAPRPEGQDVVLVYGTAGEPIPYAEELRGTGIDVVIVSPTPPQDLPEGWRHVSSSLVDADALRAAVPDLDRRRAYVSGPPAMVDGLRLALPRARTDHFAGY